MQSSTSMRSGWKDVDYHTAVLGSHEEKVYRYESYRDLWTRSQQILKKQDFPKILDLCWYEHSNGGKNNNNNNNNNMDDGDLESSFVLLLGCTGQGQIIVWKVPSSSLLSSETTMTSVETKQQDMDTLWDSVRKPYRQCQLSKGVLYSVQMVQKDQELLIVSGDEGVFVLDWNKLWSFWQNNNNNTTLTTTQLHSIIISHLKPHPSPFEKSIEINQVCWDGNCLYGAAGDSFGCYKWNMETEQLVQTYQSPGNGYLQTLQIVSPSLLLTGGEDGILAIWDIQQDGLVDQVNMNLVQPKTTIPTTTTTTINNNNNHNNMDANNNDISPKVSSPGKRKLPYTNNNNSHRWIGSLLEVNDSW